MAYMALYRKFRPVKFSEVVGQEHIEKTLKNQIINSRIGHAYLFSGGRGSGKTSTAKILARAVNCLNPQNGEPCNECEICTQALNGTLVDITEMDAASNNGVDNIREIRDEVEFIPTTGKYRVYIIDEVHMLSTGAFNALLKTLEEPPAHVIFILATTEPQKIPATILSRCQRFDFRRISEEDIKGRLQYICDSINIKIEDGALRIIANLADGAMRDAISILDRCVSDGDEVITEAKIRELSGVPEFEYLFNMTKALCDGDEILVLDMVNQIVEAGKDLNVYLWELIKFQRDIAIYIVSKTSNRFSQDEIEQIESLSKIKNKIFFLNLVTSLSQLQNSIKWAQEQRILFEAGLIRICSETNTHIIEEKNKDNSTLVSHNILLNQNTSIEDINDTLASKVLTNLKENGKMRIQADLLTTKIELQEDGIVHIIFGNNVIPATKANFQKEETKIAIKQAVAHALGKEVSVKYDNFR